MSVLTGPETAASTGRAPSPRRYLMCPPDHFDVQYAINPWMDPSQPIDQVLARAQWDDVRAAYEGLGHRVDVLPAVAGLPDMVFAANGAVVFDGNVLGSRFAYPERAPEAGLHEDWLRAAGLNPIVSPYACEGEGDFLVVGRRILAGAGFRTDPLAHEFAAQVLDAEVVSLELVDPLYYHLDTCLAVLADDQIAWLPAAFSPASQKVLRRLYPAAIEATGYDAAVLGLNAVSDGLHVMTSREATDLCAQLSAAGFQPVPLAVSELRKAGGGVKCCTMEIRS